MAWLRNKNGGWFEIPDEDVKSDYISKGTLYTNQNGARIKVLNADGKSVTYRITSDKDISLDTVSSKSEDKTVTKEGFQKMLSANGYKSQSQKEKQIETNKKEADRKNAEERQNDKDKKVANQQITKFFDKYRSATIQQIRSLRGVSGNITTKSGDTLEFSVSHQGPNYPMHLYVNNKLNVVKTHSDIRRVLMKKAGF